MPREIEQLDVAAYRIPTDQRESDGTLQWDSTTMVVVQLGCDGTEGFGYTYAHQAAALLIDDKLRSIVMETDPMALRQTWHDLRVATRNIGHRGLVAAAISAIDVALWDLKAKLLGVSLLDLLGPARWAIPVYGSGGFTSYSDEQLTGQLAGWVEQGISQVKMKVGREPERDADRVAKARRAIGPDAGLFVDANGAYSRKQAISLAGAFADQGVTWFEEPVSSEDRAGLRLVRDRAPGGMEIAAGEYGYEPVDFQRLIDAESVDVLMADATRCYGPTGFLAAAALCEAADLPMSCHTAPNLHAHLGCCALPARHIEYFHDHVRIEQMLFEGALQPKRGALEPDRSRLGMGLALKSAEAMKFCVWRCNSAHS